MLTPCGPGDDIIASMPQSTNCKVLPGELVRKGLMPRGEFSNLLSSGAAPVETLSVAFLGNDFDLAVYPGVLLEADELAFGLVIT